MKSMIAAVAAFGFIASPAFAQASPPTDNTMAPAPAKATGHHATHHAAAKHHAGHCTCAHNKGSTHHHVAKAETTKKDTTTK